MKLATLPLPFQEAALTRPQHELPPYDAIRYTQSLLGDMLPDRREADRVYALTCLALFGPPRPPRPALSDLPAMFRWLVAINAARRALARRDRATWARTQSEWRSHCRHCGCR